MKFSPFVYSTQSAKCGRFKAQTKDDDVCVVLCFFGKGKQGVFLSSSRKSRCFVWSASERQRRSSSFFDDDDDEADEAEDVREENKPSKRKREKKK